MIDIGRSFVDLCGLKVPKNLEGLSIEAYIAVCPYSVAA